MRAKDLKIKGILTLVVIGMVMTMFVFTKPIEVSAEEETKIEKKEDMTELEQRRFDHIMDEDKILMSQIIHEFDCLESDREKIEDELVKNGRFTRRVVYLLPVYETTKDGSSLVELKAYLKDMFKVLGNPQRNWTADRVAQVIKNYEDQNLRIKITKQPGGFTDLEIKFNNEVLSSANRAL